MKVRHGSQSFKLLGIIVAAEGEPIARDDARGQSGLDLNEFRVISRRLFLWGLITRDDSTVSATSKGIDTCREIEAAAEAPKLPDTNIGLSQAAIATSPNSVFDLARFVNLPKRQGANHD